MPPTDRVPAEFNMSSESGRGSKGQSTGGRRKYWIAALAILVPLLFAPQLIAWSPLRHRLPLVALKGFEGQARVGHASLSWWGPIDFRDLELATAEGETFMRIGRYLDSRGAAGMLLRPGSPVTVRVERPVIDVVLTDEGSTIGTWMHPVIERRKKRLRDRSVTVTDGVLRVVDSASGKSVEWQELSLELSTSASASETNKAHYKARLADAPDASPFELTFAWSGSPTGSPEDATQRDLTVKADRLPLACLAPVLSRVAADLEVSGETSIDIQAGLPEGADLRKGMQASGRIASTGLDIRFPSRLKGDRLTLAESDLQFKVESRDSRCRVEQLALTTDLGQLTGHGTLLLPSSNADQNELEANLSAAEFELKGDLNLVRLAERLPQTLHLHEGARLTEGKVVLSLSAHPVDQVPQYSGHVAIPHLAAIVNDRAVTWEKPLLVDFDVRRAGQGYRVEKLSSESDVLRLNGHGDLDAADVSATVELDKLYAHLSQFIDLEGTQFSGEWRLNAALKREADGASVLKGDARLERFSVMRAGSTVWSEPRLVTTFGATLVDEAHRLKEVRSAKIVTTGDKAEDALLAELTEPVLLADPEWNWNLRWGGDLARWSPRLSTIAGMEDLAVAGNFDSRTRVRISKAGIGIEELTAEVQALRITGHGYDVHEPKATLNARGSVQFAERKLNLPELTFTASSGSIQGRDVVLGRTASGFPELTGQLSISTNLDQLNPPEARAAQAETLPLSGKVRAEIAFHQQGEETLGQWDVTVEDLVIRKQKTRLVERRRGDVENVAPEPAADVPRPAPGVPLDSRARREMRRAERRAKDEARRREREARKRAREVVRVPMTEWKTVWSDPHMTLSGTSRFARQEDLVELTKLTLKSDGLEMQARGKLTDVTKEAAIDLQGEVDYDSERLITRLREELGPYVVIQGKEQRKFSIVGPLHAPEATLASTGYRGEKIPPERAGDLVEGHVAIRPASHQVGPLGGVRPLVSLDLKGQAGLGWESGNLFGLQTGRGDIDFRLSRGIVAMQPLEMEVSGGRLTTAPQVLLTGRPVILVVPAGPMITDVQLSQELCDAWLKFLAPVVADAARVEGVFSLELNDTRLPVSDVASGDLSGRLTITTAQVLPGPIVDELAEMLGQMQSAIGLNRRDILGVEKPLVRIENQQVEFRLQDRRLHHSPLAFNLRNIGIRTYGSVGADQSLDLIAEISLPDEWLRVPVLSQLRGKALEVPIRGTLKHPDIDASGIGRIFEEFGTGLLDSLLNRGLPGIFERKE